ncbi:hypothetical protein [uncultured Cytophaga sp.]|uniref:hypothetical protein n=1 Tax=uncultured Cytophaga sp. TaxID=160238 RepID=UPI002617EED9|nr:hypothetical protein [uncultured Cytophaga sp.]
MEYTDLSRHLSNIFMATQFVFRQSLNHDAQYFMMHHILELFWVNGIGCLGIRI